MRIKSGILAVVAVGIALLCWFVLNLLGKIAADQEIALSGFVAWWVHHPYIIVVVAAPAIAIAVMAAAARRPVWLWALMSLLCALIPVAIVLYCFIAVTGTLYRYQPL